MNFFAKESENREPGHRKTLVFVFILLTTFLAGFVGYWFFLRLDSPLLRREEDAGTPVSSIDQDFVEVEPGTDLDTAEEISFGRFRGVLERGDEAAFKIFVHDGHLFLFSLTPETGSESMSLQVLSSDREEIWIRDEISPEETVEGRKLMSDTSGGIYYLRIFSGAGSYTLVTGAESQDDAGSGGDAGGEPSTVIAVEENLFRGVIGHFDEADMYQITLDAGQTLTLATERNADSIAIKILDSNEEEVWYREGIGAAENESYTFGDNVDSFYYVRVAYGTGGYTMSVE